MRFYSQSSRSLYKEATKRYQSRFRRQVPQWVQSLGNGNVRALINLTLKLNWKLPPKILVGEEEPDGVESLWSTRQTRLDAETAWRFAGKFKPQDLQSLPVDPAEAAVRSYLKSRR